MATCVPPLRRPAAGATRWRMVTCGSTPSDRRREPASGLTVPSIAQRFRWPRSTRSNAETETYWAAEYADQRGDETYWAAEYADQRGDETYWAAEYADQRGDETYWAAEYADQRGDGNLLGRGARERTRTSQNAERRQERSCRRGIVRVFCVFPGPTCSVAESGSGCSGTLAPPGLPSARRSTGPRAAPALKSSESLSFDDPLEDVFRLLAAACRAGAHELAHADRVDAHLVVAARVVACGIGDDLDEITRRVVDVVDLRRIAVRSRVDVSQSTARALRHFVRPSGCWSAAETPSESRSSDGTRASSSTADTVPTGCNSVAAS